MLNSRVYGKRDRDKSYLGCLGLRNWRKKNEQYVFCIVRFFEISEKTDF